MSKELAVLGGIIVLVIIIAVIGTSYYRNSSTTVPQTVGNNAATPLPNNEVLVREDSRTLGPADAKVTIVEFYDPECESCALFHPILKKTLKDYEGKVRLVSRYMPLHPNSVAAATFLEEAGEQGKYWEAQEYLLQKQPEWGTRHGHGAQAPQPDAKALFKKYTTDLGLDPVKMEEAFAQNKYFEKIARDRKDGESLGVRQTPTIFVNGKKLDGLDEMRLHYMIESGMK